MNFKKELYSAGDLLDESKKQLCQSLVGSLMWAMIGTRPGIAFAIGETFQVCLETLSKACDCW